MNRRMHTEWREMVRDGERDGERQCKDQGAVAAPAENGRQSRMTPTSPSIRIDSPPRSSTNKTIAVQASIHKAARPAHHALAPARAIFPTAVTLEECSPAVIIEERDATIAASPCPLQKSKGLLGSCCERGAKQVSSFASHQRQGLKI